MRSCDELVDVALRRRELRSQAADVGGSRGGRRHCRHCCNLKADHDLPAWYARRIIISHLTAVLQRHRSEPLNLALAK